MSLDIIEYMNKKPKRICFNTTHQGALQRVNIPNNTVVGTINIPFDESIRCFIENETGVRVIEKNNGKYWCPANSQDEYSKLQKFFEKYKEAVFLRDTLDCSIAISEHMKDENDRTDIGELEYQCKYKDDNEAFEKLTKIIIEFINNAPIYKNVDLICAVPSSTKDSKNLPQRIVDKIKDDIRKIDISDKIAWAKDKPELKELCVEKKAEVLNDTGLDIDTDTVKDKDIIIVDDLYQSGLTMNYIAGKLKETGARKIFGISIVKSRKDTDND